MATDESEKLREELYHKAYLQVIKYGMANKLSKKEMKRIIDMIGTKDDLLVTTAVSVIRPKMFERSK